MALVVIASNEECLMGTDVVRALRRHVEARGSAVLLVPSLAQVVDAQRALATVGGLALGVKTTTLSVWARDCWETWGDGRSIADGSVLTVLAAEAMRSALPDDRGPLALLPGTVSVIARLVADSLPWLPLDERGQLRIDVCEHIGLASGEMCLVRMAGKLAQLLAQFGYVSASEAAAIIAAKLVSGEVPAPHAVATGFSWAARAERELLGAFARGGELSFVVPAMRTPAFEQAWKLVDALCEAQEEGSTSTVTGETNVLAVRDSELQDLLDDLFGDTRRAIGQSGPVELLLPAGPLAEAEIVARRVCELVGSQADVTLERGPSVVVVVPDVHRAWRELVPKLEERGVSARIQWTQPLTDSASACAFLDFALEVARLSELAASWPEPRQGLEGPVPQLGDMSWWSPRSLIDFLFEDFSHVEPQKAWRLDAAWRGNRLLTPARVLEMLQSERLTSAPVARATAELLRGRIGSAAAKLLAPYAGVHEARDAAADEARAVLEGMLGLARTIRSLGVTFDPQHPDDRSLSELVALMGWAAEGRQMVSRIGVGPNKEHPEVLIMGMSQATQLAQASMETVVVCGLTSTEQPIEGKEDVLQAILEQLGVEPKANPLAESRAEFRAALGVARSRVVMERALCDVDGKETYPSVMFAELMSVYGVSAGMPPAQMPFGVGLRSERLLTRNLSDTGLAAERVAKCEVAPAGLLTAASRELVFVPQAGRDTLPDGLPILSASQIETYLECPYKWFSLRRLRLGTVDAGHSAPEMGTFAHRVLEVTHRELLMRALEAENMGIQEEMLTEEELLARVELDPARHIEGSRVTEKNLEEATAALELEFDLHREHMYLERRPRASQQLLIAHDSSERAQEQQLKEDLVSTLAYQTRVLEGFEPRFFEWSFGRHEQLVPYAGAYITGTVDRIDVSPHGTAVIIDYKNKRPSGFAAEYDALQDGVLEGAKLPSRVQSLIYAQVVRRAFEGRLQLVGSVYLSTKSPHALAGVADANVVDLVLGNVSDRRLPRVSVPPNEEGAPGMGDLLDHTEELIAEQVQQMLAGNVKARPRDMHSCDFCPVTQCEKRVAQ